MTTSVETQRYQAACDWLYGRINYERTHHMPYGERQLKLDRMRTLVTRLGQPDAALKIVHIAGTKGKGSTGAMIAAILTAAGYRAGVFSSPHLERIEERFAVDGEPCSREEFTSLVDRLRPVVEAMDREAAAEGDPLGGPTYFEATTAIALVHFAERQVDAAVLEVGLGGRLDATNVCLPVVSVITSISFDHTQQLGNTLAAIAGEKAGIIKPGVPVVSGVTAAEPQAVIAEVAREHGCRLIQMGKDFGFSATADKLLSDGGLGGGQSALQNPQSAIVYDVHCRLADRKLSLHALTLGMRGEHQAANAAIALATVAELRHQGWCISTDAMRAGIARAALAGRVELFPEQPPVVLDTAHNQASAEALVQALDEMTSGERRTLVLSVSRDKDARAIVAALVPHFARVVVTQFQENPRAVAVGDLAKLVQEISPRVSLEICARPADALSDALKQSEPDELVCIAGSFFLASELRQLLVSRREGSIVSSQATAGDSLRRDDSAI